MERKTSCLQSLERENVKLSCIFDILLKTGIHVDDVFKSLHSLWFNQTGEKTQYLKTLEANGRSLCEICEILKGDGFSVAEKFKEFFLSLPSVESPLDRLIGNLICKQEIKQEVTEEGEKGKLKFRLRNG